jgi:hypothetical protein
MAGFHLPITGWLCVLTDSYNPGMRYRLRTLLILLAILPPLRATPLGTLAPEKAGFTENGEYEKSQTPHHTN